MENRRWEAWRRSRRGKPSIGVNKGNATAT